MKTFLVIAILIVMGINAFAQIGINTDNSIPDNSSQLDIKSSSKGLLIPRLTMEQIQTITNPANSLLVFCTTNNTFYAYITSSSEWKEVLFGTGVISPTCGIPITDIRDNKVYYSVQIGTQCWMANNLNTGTRIDYGLGQSNNSIIEKYCYNNLESNCDTSGGLYQWNEMMQYSTIPGIQGICPAGWHLPTDEELTTLTSFLGGNTIAGGKMKEKGTSHWTAPNTQATNESGFTMLPGGFRNYVGGIGLVGERGSLWSSTFNSGAGYNCSWNIDLFNNSGEVTLSGGAMWSNGFSVRCLKD